MSEPAVVALSEPPSPPSSGTAPPQPEEISQQGVQKKKNKGVRFATTADGEVVPDRVRFERHTTSRTKAQEALECLLAGNQRFLKLQAEVLRDVPHAQGNLERCRAGIEVVQEVAGEVAKPTTVILSCSDSRVPPEIVMDQGLGDCHVVRVAGNVVNDFVLGSIIFAVQHLGCRLVVVLGHSRCSVVASAVQTWARKKSLSKENPTVRTLAEGVQQTLGRSPAPPMPSQVSVVNSPFSTAEAQKAESVRTPKPTYFARLCGSCGGGVYEVDEAPAISGASTPMQTLGQGNSENKKSASEDRSHRSSIGRVSINPLSALVGAMGAAVEAVANSGQHDAGLKSLVHKENRNRDRGWDSDDEDLKRGLTKQDSLEFTRARLAKQRAERKIEALRQLATRDDVDSVIEENTKVSASTILKGLVKNLDTAIVHDMEVVAAKYDVESGSVNVLSRAWYQNHTYYNSLG